MGAKGLMLCPRCNKELIDAKDECCVACRLERRSYDAEEDVAALGLLAVVCMLIAALVVSTVITVRWALAYL